MAYSPSHKNAASMSSTNLVPPSSTDGRQRRMTASSLPPPSPLNLPEPVYGHRRPPSPLRHGLTIDPSTGEISDDASVHTSESSHEGGHGGRSHSPSPSVAKFAANLAQRVGSFVSNMSPRSNALPTDDELEAEAEREREKSRREAERILMQEAEDRRTVEERVMAMLHGNAGGGGGSPKSLTPPPPLSQTMSSNPPSPQSLKDASWWTMARSKLTPAKEPLTPAQQVIQETKAREKEYEKEKKKGSKMKQKSKDSSWPSVLETRYEDPSFFKLGLAATSSYTQSFAAATPSPTPFHTGLPSTPPSLSASPLRTNDAGTPSPTRAAPPLYAQFNAQGTLDVPGTLLTIVKRFEKLEKWTVGHVRALEARMDDVERWLVEKEKEKEQEQATGKNAQEGDGSAVEGAIDDIREELAELQGRVGEIGREMARLVTAPGNLSLGPSRNPAAIGRAPSTNSSVAVRSISQNMSSPTSTSPKVAGSTSPPGVTTPVVPSRTSRTRLPYPTGDYATPPDSTLLSQGVFSPTNSPPSSITSATKQRHTSLSGLPTQSTSSTNVSPSGLPQPMSAASNPAFSAPSIPAARPSSESPTPRKRYTVALGGPIMSADRADRERPSTPHSRTESRELSTAFFSTSPLSLTPSHDDTTDDSDAWSGANEETIGKAGARHTSLAIPSDTSSDASNNGRPTSTSPSGASLKRSRPRSVYSSQFSNIAAPAPVTPLNSRLRSRSRSTDRFGLGISDASGQTKEAMAGAAPNPPKVMQGKPKVPVGELVAFFDQEKV